jgi:hypothetical protein
MSKCYDNPEYDKIDDNLQNTWKQSKYVEPKQVEKEIMKNIHILQTDQPTGIFETNSGLQFSIMNKVRHGEFKGFHIYITSSEEIKEVSVKV